MAARPENGLYIYGVHAVEAALNNPARSIRQLYATENAAQRVLAAIRAADVEPLIVEPDVIDRMLPQDSVHQGLLIVAAALPPSRLEDLPGAGPVVFLDQVTDPHNVGAIMRSACAFGAEALVVTTRNAPQPSDTLAKAASGALEHLPYIQVTNLARSLKLMNDMGYQTIGLTGDADRNLQGVMDSGEHRRPAALVMGAEGRGIRELTAKTCTDLAKLPLNGPIKVLNVSNAAAVALQILTRVKSGAGCRS
ncbi:MAG: RNA methyltransferase [Fimbriimonadaceae bacterium]|nr:RNA methyltransferase [Alphaproteobacteria bacterium]